MDGATVLVGVRGGALVQRVVPEVVESLRQILEAGLT
jgi:hypothetical protein